MPLAVAHSSSSHPFSVLKKVHLPVSRHRLGGALPAGGASLGRCNSSLGERALGRGRWSSALAEEQKRGHSGFLSYVSPTQVLSATACQRERIFSKRSFGK